MTLITLHGYWRSSAAYRTRIALNLKGLPYDTVTYDLRLGAQASPGYAALNAQRLVPTLQTEQGLLSQSPAILEWLDEAYPAPPLLPADPWDRAQVRAMAALVACDVHPLNNLRVLKALRQDFTASESQVQAWIARWITEGFTGLEILIGRQGDGWSYGASPTLADCHLVPQIYSARRFSVDLTAFPAICAIEARAAYHPAFQAAHPDRQPDAD